MAILNETLDTYQEDYVAFAARVGLPLLVVTTLVVLWLLPGLLARTAKQIIQGYGKKYIRKTCTHGDARFTATAKGYQLRHFGADSNSLQLQLGPYEISRLDVAEAELVWPSWQHQRLQLHVKGLQLVLLQRQMPQAAVAPPNLAAAGQLEVLEQLLWHGNVSTASNYSKRSSWLRAWLLKAALGRVELQLQDCCVQYVVPGQLGPAAVGQTTSHRDGIVISVRSISLAPAAAARHAAENAASTAADSPSTKPSRSGLPSTGNLPQQSITQLNVAGVSVVVVSSQNDAAPPAADTQAPSTSYSSDSRGWGPGAAEIAACLDRNSWKQVHVLLRQWQCSVSVATSEAGNMSQQAQQTPAASHGEQLLPAAVCIRFWTAGVAEMDDSTSSELHSAHGQNKLNGPLGRLRVMVEMKSLVLSLPPSAAAITNRLLTRHSQYKQLSPVWSVRPRQPVSASPAAWWQHACKVVLVECRRRRPACSFRLALRRRREYLSLYRALHSQQLGYNRSGRASKHKDVPTLLRELHTIESTMTACEISTHRIFVALVHSQHLQHRPALQQQWLEALDGLGGFVDLIPGRGQGTSYSEPGLAVSLSCPAISVRLTSNNQPHVTQLVAEANSIHFAMPVAGGAAATVQQLRLSVRDSSSSQPWQTTGVNSSEPSMLPVLSLPHAGNAASSTVGKAAAVAQNAPAIADSVPRPSKLGHIYPDSLVAAYLSQFKVRLGAVHLQLEPQLAEQLIDYFKAFREAAELAGDAGERLVPVKQMVLDSFKHHKEPLSFALSVLLPMLDISCPQLTVAAPLKSVQRLDSLDDARQAVPDAAVELMLRISQLHASVGYNSSCYSSLLQQVDATADIELLFQQTAASPAAAQQQAGRYGVVWMHPDDSSRLSRAWVSTPQVVAPRRSFGGGMPVSGVNSLDAGQLGNMYGKDRSPVPLTAPYVPLVKLQRLWARLSTHIPTEPAVAGGEHTTAGVSLAGVLLWVSPWQVKLLLSTAQQLTADGEAVWQRLKHTLHSPEPSALAAASNAAAATTVQAAIKEAQEAGSAAAAASKAATAAVQTAGVVAPAAVFRDSAAAGPPVVGVKQQKQQAGKALSAKEASRAAASQASISLLCEVPYLEVLCFTDLSQPQGVAGGSNRAQHRYCIQPATAAGISFAKASGLEQRQLPQQGSLIQQWSTCIAPVASMVLCELRACSSTAADGALEAKVHVSSMLCVNLQLLDLCRSSATLPTAAGVYLPAGYTVPARTKHSAHPPQRSHVSHSVGGVGDNSETAAATAAERQTAAGLSANHNAFVLSTFTPRLTASYQAAALSRWQLLGLSRLAAEGVGSGAGGSAGSLVSRGHICRSLLLRRRWQQVLRLRSFARTLDYAMFLLFQQGQSSQSHQRDSHEQAAGSRFDQYQLLYRHCLSVAEEAAPMHEDNAVWIPSRRGSTSSDGQTAAAVSLQPGSPCNWKSSSFRRRVIDRLVVEQLSGSGSVGSSADGPASLAGLSKQQQQQLYSSRIAEQAAAPLTPGRATERLPTAASTPGRTESHRGSAVGTPRGGVRHHSLQQPVQARSNVRGALFPPAPDASSGEPAAEQPAAPIQGMRIFSALRGLRGGSQGLLQRLWHRKQAKQHAQAIAAATSSKSRLAGDDACSRGALEGLQQQESSWPPVPDHDSTRAQQHGQQHLSLVDFLDRFTVDCIAVDPASHAGLGSNIFRRNSTGTIGSSPAATPRSNDSATSRSTVAVSSLQPQLAVMYIQQPSQHQRGQQRGRPGVLAASMQEPEDVIDVTLCHLKCSLGPHTVSMLLQLMAGLSAAAGARQHAADAQQQSAEAAAKQGSNPSHAAAVGRLRMNFRLVLCHALLNMERTLLPGHSSTAAGSSVELQTKALASLLLLDAKASVVRQYGAALEAASPTGSLQQTGTEANCSVAHIGLQDLCACEEQRHLLSGADEPYRASSAQGNQSSRPRQKQAACSLVMHALLPGPGMLEPALVTLSLFNPKLVLVRRFVNDVLYVTALFNHELAACSRADGSVKSKSKQETSSAAATVMLVTLHNVQMILPRSHACKTLDNKYAEAERIHREAEKQRQQQAAEADQQEPNVEAWSGNSTSSTHGNSFDAADEQASRQGLKQSLDDSCRQGPLHAHHPEVVLLQVSSITIAAPADPTLLQQVHIDPAMRGQCLYTADPPLWMRDSAAVKQILANSRAIMICSGAPAHQQQNPVSSAADGATASTAMADPEVALNPSAGLAASQQLQQQLPRSLEDKKHVQFTVGRKQKPAAAVRHGVLLVTEDGVSEADLDAQLAPVPSFSVATAASRLWRQFVAKVQPRRSRLIVRPDNAEAFRAATGTAAVISGAAKSAASTSAFVAGLPAGQVPAGRADAAGGGGEDASGALLLLDFHGLELFAGKVLREQDTASWRSASSAAVLSRLGLAGATYRPDRCSLTNLVHMITRTNVQTVVYEYAASTDAAAATPGAAAAAAPANVIALSAQDGLALQLSNSSYKYLMDTVNGNLTYCHSTFEAGAIHINPPPALHTEFQPNLKFGPGTGQMPSFGLTLSSSTVQGTLWADQRWWTPSTQHPSPQQAGDSPFVTANSTRQSSSTVPFVSAALQQASLCVQLMKASSDLHVNVYAEDTEWRDVRMANKDASAVGASFRRRRQLVGRRTEYEIAHDDLKRSDNLERFEQARQLAARSSTEGDSDAAAFAPCSYAASTGFDEQLGGSSSLGQQVFCPSGPIDEIEAADVEEPLSPETQGVRSRSPGRSPGLGPASTRPINLYSRLDRLTPKPESADDDGSIHGISSEETVGEQQLDMSELYPSLLQPSAEGLEEVPDISIIRTLGELPADESAHLPNKGKRASSSSGVAPSESAGFKFHMGYLKEGTMTVEVTLASTLLQWPYLSDMSLVSAIINIFYNDWGAAPKLPPTWLQLKRNAWLYFNLVITDSQIFMPLLTPHISNSSTAGAPPVQQCSALNPYAVLREVVMKQASLTGEDIECGRGQPLQQEGLALTFGAFRFGYFYGGDGEAMMRFDVRNMAGFVRDPNAVITNWLLPLPSAKLEMRYDLPMVEEHKALQPLLMISRRMLLYYAVRKRERRRRQREARAAAGLTSDGSSGLPAAGSGEQHTQEQDKQDNASGSYTTSAARSAAAAAATPEQRLLALACEHAEEMFGERVTADWHNTWAKTHGHSQPVQASMGLFGQSSSGMFGVYKRKARSELVIVVAPVTLRAAFSNVNTWKTLQADMAFAGRSLQAGLGMWPPRPDIQAEVLAVRAAGGVWPPPPTGWAAEFRRSSMRCSIDLTALTLMLCDDKPHSFGAPDVLQAVARGVSFVHAIEHRYPRTQPERADRLFIEGGVGMSILNNSNSKWEVMLEPWPLLLSLSDPINPLSKADRTLYGQALSSEPLRVNFHPSSLLSIGDLLAFIREVSSAPASSSSQQPAALQLAHSVAVPMLEEAPSLQAADRHAKPTAAGPAMLLLPGPQQRVKLQQPVRGLNHTEAPPSIEQQMALGEGVSSRIPQRYLIQNLTGSHLHYWSPADEATRGMHGAKKRVLLPAHGMHELKVTPALRKMQHLAADGSLVSSGFANAICIQLAGSWLPLENVAVDVVGKYRYEVRDPLGSTCLPLMLDVLLVGRTKMLRLHSCIWLENNTGMKLEPCLQLGHGCMTPVVLGPGDKLDSLQRLHLRALKPKEGRFLPAAAALGGLLFLAPEGHLPAEHDVLRLDVSLKALSQQQGYITCQSKPDGIQHGPLHLAATVRQGLQTDPYFTTQNLTEVPRPGTLRKARVALEASIHISPTLQLANGLPYDVLGWALVPPVKIIGRGSDSQSANSAGSKAAEVAAKLRQKLSGDNKDQQDATDTSRGDHVKSFASNVRVSLTGGASVAQSAAVAAGAGANRSTGLQQVLAAGDRGTAAVVLGTAVASAGSPMQILQHLSLVDGNATASPTTPVAQTGRNRRSSWFGGVSGAGSMFDHSADGLAVQRHRASGVTSPTPHASFIPSQAAAGSATAGDSAGTIRTARQAEKLQLSQACELLLLQRWCKDLLLEDFLTTLHLVLSPTMASQVDVAALWLLDLPSLVALALGVLAEEFGWIAKSFPQAFSLVLKVEAAMNSTNGTGSSSNSDPTATKTLQAHQLPWAADQLPIAELFALLQWLQQSVVRLQLAPGGTADLYLDPRLEVYAALRVPVLAMQSRPTLITGGLGNHALSGSDSLWLSYTSKLDSGLSSQQQSGSNSNRQSLADSEQSFAGQPRLGLAALQALARQETMHQEITMRMTDVARQLAELASRQKINPLHGRTASDHGVATWMGASGDSDGFLSVPASVLAAGSAVAAGWAGSSSYKQQLLQPWSSAPGGLPVSYPATSGSQSTLGQQQLSAPAPESINHAAVLPWFAVVVELLGDIVRLSMHEAEVVLQDSSGDAARASRQRRRFVPEQLLDELELADTALFVLADSLHLQAVYRAGSDQPPKDSSSQPRAVKGQLHVSRSSNQLADERFSGAGSVAGDADQAGITVNIPATMTSMSDVLLTPPADIDRIFTQFNLHKGHVLSDDEMQALLRFSCQALIDHIVTNTPVSSAADHPLQSLQHARAAVCPAPLQPSGLAEAAGSGSSRRPRFAVSTSDSEISLLQSPRSSSSMSFSPQPGYASPSGTVRPLSRLQQPTWQDNMMYCSSPTDSTEAASVPQTPALFAPPSTPTAAAKKQPAVTGGLDEQQHHQPRHKLQPVAPDAAASSSSRARPDHTVAAATSPSSSMAGTHAGSSGPVKGFRSLRSLWPLAAGHSVPGEAAGRAAAVSAGVSRAGLFPSRRPTGSSSDESEGSDEEANPLSPRPRGSWQGSFRRMPGASVRHLARAMGRATGGPVRLVHGQLSDQLRAALDRKMRSTPHHLLPPGPISGRYTSPLESAASGPGSGILRHHGHQWLTMTMQALGRGAVAAEVQEGRPGFCAPHNLKLSFISSGGYLGYKQTTKGGSGSHKRSSSDSNSATRHILLTASFWLDNRSGLNLVLSDLDRRIIKGISGPRLKNTADVHSPGLPRDSAALEAAEPDLSTLLANSSRSHDNLLDAAEQSAESTKSTVGSQGAEADVEMALSRLQEVRPALLNDQSWLRFWVEEHVVLPPGSKLARAKSRRTFSFSKAPASVVSALSSPGAAGMTSGIPPVEGSSSAPVDVTATGQVQAIRSQPSGFFKIAVTGHKTDIQVKGKIAMAQIWDRPEASGSAIGMDTSSVSGIASNSQSRQELLGRAALVAFAGTDSNGDDVANGQTAPLHIWDPAVPLETPVQRLYEFAVEVWPTPAEGPFKATKVVSIKSKYILFNDTGMVLEYKQKGTPDPNHPGYKSYGDGRRFAGLLQPQERVSFHWDNIAEQRLLLIRPAAPGWPWSGAFPLIEKEDYVGLRLRNRCNEAALIIPVNTTVGRSGSVLVTFKSTNSVPPLRIENRTKSVTIMLRQQLEAARIAGATGPVGVPMLSTAMPGRKESSPRSTNDVPAGWAWDTLTPGSSLPFAWDDITSKDKSVVVAAGALGPGAHRTDQLLSAGKHNTFVLDLDSIQKKPHVMLVRPVNRPTTRRSSAAAAAGQAAASAETSAGPPGSARTPSVSIGNASAARASPRVTEQQQQQPAVKPMLSIKVGPAAGAAMASTQGRRDGRPGSSREPSVHDPTASAAGLHGAAAASSHTEPKATGKVKGTVFDKKMYVSLYADGPTRVLCFSDTPIAGSDADDEGGSQQLMSRLHQVARQLLQVDRQLASYLGSSYAVRAARGSRAVPAVLLMQQQQQQGRASASDAQLPAALQNTAGWYTSGTAAAAVALLQQMGLHPTASLDDNQPQPVGSAAGSAASGAMGPAAEQAQTKVQAAQVHGSEAAVEPAPSRITQSHISSRAAVGAAAAAAAGINITDGLLSVDAADGGLRLYYDKLTLLLDSGLPLGGNCKVKLLSARDLVPTGTDCFYGYQAMLGVSGRRPVPSSMATPVRDQQDVSWEHEELFTEVTAVSELAVEVWGIPYTSVFGRRGQHTPSSSSSRAPGDSPSRRYLRSQSGIAANSVFLGAVQIPLIHTLPGTSNGGKEPRWYSLLRLRGDQQVSGQLQVSIAWSFTRETLLSSELSVLERLLDARQEVLALLRPLSTSRVARMMGLVPAGSSFTAAEAGRAADRSVIGSVGGPSALTATESRGQTAYLQDDADGSSISDEAYGEVGTFLSAGSDSLEDLLGRQRQQQHRQSIISCPSVFAGLDLGLADSSVVTLELDVVEIANLGPRSGWSQDLTHALLNAAGAGGNRSASTSASASLMLSEMVKSSDLPLPVVYVFCGTGQPTDEGIEVASGVHTLNPCFARSRHQFRNVGLRSTLRVLVYDRRSALDSRLLGVARLPAASIPAGSGPLYMWLPLSPPPRKGQNKLARLQGYMPGAMHGKDAANRVSFSGISAAAPMLQSTAGMNPAAYSQQQLQVLLRVRIVKPATHNTTASLQANLAGLLLNAKTPGGDELLNLTIDTVQCAMLTTTRERQLSVSVRSVQLDNQLLETRQPVVLSPATQGEELEGYNLPKDKHRITLITDKTLDDMESPARTMFKATNRTIQDSSAGLQAAPGGKQLQVTASGSSVSAAARKVPLIRVSLCQTLTKPINGAEEADSVPEGQPATSTAGTAAGSATAASHTHGSASSSIAGGGSSGRGGSSVAGGTPSKSAVSKAAIMSFRKVELLMGALDLKTDQAFLEAVFMFIQSMPLADLWQDAAWQQHIALLQGATTAGDSGNSEQRQQQPIPAALAGRRSTIAAVPPLVAGAAGNGTRQQLSAAAAAARLHAQQSPQLPSSTAHHAVAHGRSRSVGSVPANWDLQVGLQQSAADFAAAHAAASPGQPYAAAATSAAVTAKAAKKAAAARRAALNSILVLAWLPGKHDQELNSMKGQSSTWYFLEKLYVSALCMNVTIALTSSIRTAAATGQSSGGTGPGSLPAVGAGAGDGLSKALGPGAMLSEVQRTVVKGMVNRLSGGDNGLQLINVSDVALRLSSFKLENRLLNQVGLSSELYRHYFWAALAELRKVLGGAGPGLVQLPASIIWAGFSVVDLLLELQQGRRKPLHSAFALMHVVFTLFSQLSGVATRFVVSMYALVPVQRHGTLSDHSALQRYVRMPATAGEAFYQAVVELYLGTAAGVLGLFLDPAAGMRLPGALGVAGALVGLMKGAGGLMVRPAMGVLDASSKCLKGIGLLFLGKRGIQGKLVRRVRPPGASEGPAGLAGSSLPAGPMGQLGAPGRGLDDATLHDALVASWQARLPALSVELEGDQVVDVMATRSCRLLLLTRRHVLYLRASVPTRGQQAGSFSYTIRWLLPCSRVDHVRGEEERLKIVLEYHSQLRVPQVSGWRQQRATAARERLKKVRNPAAVHRSVPDKAAAVAAISGQQAAVPVEAAAAVPVEAAAAGRQEGHVFLRIPLQRSLRCASPELYQLVIRAISRHLVQMMAAPAAAPAATGMAQGPGGQLALRGPGTELSLGPVSRHTGARSLPQLPPADNMDLYNVP